MLPQAIEVVSRFVPRGQTVVSVKGAQNFQVQEILEPLAGTIHDFPLVVLINGGSASASEIVAGAVQDYGRGLVVGSDSFGKGLVQKVFPLPYGTGLTLTTARYYTPYGRSLQRDYSSGSIYDYFTHNNGNAKKDNESDEDAPKVKPKGKAVKTAGDRVFYGGRGIEPDLKAPSLVFNNLRYRISESVFFLLANLLQEKLADLSHFKTYKQSFVTSISRNDIQITNSLFDSFVSYTISNKKMV